MSLDKKDKVLIHALQRNARLSNSALAHMTNLSDTPCLRRVKKLEQEGVIQGYHAALNRKALGLAVLVYAFVRLNENSATAADSFEQHVASLDHVLSCSVISGSYDYLLEVVAHDLEHYEFFLKHRLATHQHVTSVESTIVLKQTFTRRTLPI
ncbi:Transcriptional regulator, AsnC family [Pseudoalteromonas luteoviolacea B = ATCC 29581]|nr:Transcriptional regulator, AsnC family [Pseudoalteromonas luteoviolacea B = ATCC 29581]